MIRLDEKKALIQDVLDIYSLMSRYTGDPNSKEKGRFAGCIPKKLKKRADKSILRDFIKGLRQIDKKCPVFVELAKLKKEGNGMYSEVTVNSNTDVDTKEIIVSDVRVVSSQQKNEL